MNVAITGLGTARPKYVLTQDRALAMAQERCCHTARQSRLLPALYRRSRVDQRNVVTAIDQQPAKGNGDGGFFPPATGEADRGPTTGRRMSEYAAKATPLAAAAARAALSDACVRSSAVTHVVTASCTGFAAPGIDLRLVESLELPRTTQRTHVGFMGCHGAFNAMQVAHAIVRGDPQACVLVCAVELCSLHFSYGFDPQRIVANALFADGAGAFVVSGAPQASAGAWTLAATGSCLLADSEDHMTWRIGDHGFEMTLSPQVPVVIAGQLRPWLESWLADLGVSVEDVATWAVHPGGPRILDAVESALDLAPGVTAVSRATLRACGNMSSATICFILERLRRAGAPRPCVAMGFGPGLVAEAMLLT
jgi:predicted naringenin-chalcone synthase